MLRFARSRFVVPLLLTLIGAALGYGLWPRMPGESSTEVRFVREMIQHHTQAVDMSIRVRERSQDRTVRSLALDILLSQQEQIGQMHGWLTLWGRPWGGAGMSAEHARMMGMATPAQVAALDTLPPQQADRHFLTLMIRHHDGALAMVEPALKKSIRPEVQALARQIQATQAAEIKVMADMLRARGTQAPPEPRTDQAPSGHQH
ncbi:DUF305 domain-containing protein [Deinococcus deserti]|uniref:DUF305 domain-containing protein n=1 Tax=Deinococcus deserti (strain DSM 17065 / CIP 109153 / LMG 22923 / VCD115) TaxID=546414 RepID=C1D0L3_DEIDV|nr:DUF305 domain-containing protein [Deinococcus deserti]ACO45387.1 Conserved hypothetical protein, precursor [Deinococcus deserti VCD115]